MTVDQATIEQLRREIQMLRSEVQASQVRMALATVLAVDEVAKTVTLQFPGVNGTLETVAGVVWPGQFLPEVGDTVQVQIIGSLIVPILSTLAQNAVTERELAPDSVTEAAVTIELRDALLAEASGSTVFFNALGDPPSGQTAGDLWVQPPDNTVYRWTGTAWVETQDQNIATALLEALAAAQAAAQAQADALAALALADGKTTAYYGSSAPTGDLSVDDLWVRSTDKRLHRWDGDSWEPIVDAAISEALDDAATAQAVADGKVRIFAQADPPGGMTAGDVGDMWIETDNGNRVHTWDGDSWEMRRLGNNAIEPQSLVASDVVATGTVSAGLLESLMVLTNTLIAGTPGGNRVVISAADGVKLIKGASTLAAVLDLATGKLIAHEAELRTTASGTRIEILPTTGAAELRAYIGGIGQFGGLRLLTFDDTGQIEYAGGSTPYNRPGLELRPPSLTGSIKVPTLVLGSANEVSGSPENHSTTFLNSDRIIAVTFEGLEFRGPLNPVPSGSAYARIQPGGFVEVHGDGLAHHLLIGLNTVLRVDAIASPSGTYGLALTPGVSVDGEEWQSRPSVDSTGYSGLAASFFRTASARDLKVDIASADLGDVLEGIAATEPRQFVMDGDPDGTLLLGFVADELPPAMQSVDAAGEATGYTVNAGLAYLWAGMRELITQNATLRQDVEALRAQVEQTRLLLPRPK